MDAEESYRQAYRDLADKYNELAFRMSGVQQLCEWWVQDGEEDVVPIRVEERAKCGEQIMRIINDSEDK